TADGCHHRRRARPMGAALPPLTAHGAGHVPRGGGLARHGGEGMMHLVRRTAYLVALTGWLIAHDAAPAVAQSPATGRFALLPTPMWMAADMLAPMPGMVTTAQTSTGPHAGMPHAAAGTTTLPNLTDRSGWPSPVDDTATYSFFLFDLLEYQRT